ncbi:TetR/AcrR family transcriptional regulator [Edaphobacter bradus]|uniref:TetR/AcrR family transcriptional regulator n=1 Tax=Edaphobacter bradus TaxID=2259016 RepID=UPI0021E0BAEC|nr:TetR family transcriptional regulator [Edaphobacter bradus]
MENEAVPCKRPYSLGKRLEGSDNRRARILAAARAQLRSGGLPNLRLEALARESEVTRQTVHNLFRTKSGVVEALFDQMARSGGMEQMRLVMQHSDPAAMLTGFVRVFTGFWRKDRLLIRRIHGIAAVDPEFGDAVEARNQRRRMASRRVVEVLRGGDSDDKERKAAILYALTSFEFFDALAEASGSEEAAAATVLDMVKETVDAERQPDV